MTTSVDQHHCTWLTKRCAMQLGQQLGGQQWPAGLLAQASPMLGNGVLGNQLALQQGMQSLIAGGYPGGYPGGSQYVLADQGLVQQGLRGFVDHLDNRCPPHPPLKFLPHMHWTSNSLPRVVCYMLTLTACRIRWLVVLCPLQQGLLGDGSRMVDVAADLRST